MWTGCRDSGGEKLKEELKLWSSLKKEFSKETKVMKMMKAFIRSKECVEEATYVWKKTKYLWKSTQVSLE